MSQKYIETHERFCKYNIKEIKETTGPKAYCRFCSNLISLLNLTKHEQQCKQKSAGKHCKFMHKPLREAKMEQFKCCKLCNKWFFRKYIKTHEKLCKPKEVNIEQEFNCAQKQQNEQRFACKFCKTTLLSHEDLENHEILCEKLRNQKESKFQYVIKNETTGRQTSSQSGPHDNEDSIFCIKAFNAVLRCPSCKRYYRKETFKHHTCKNEVKSQSQPYSIPQNTASGTSFIVISPLPSDSNAQDRYKFESKTETTPSESELNRESHTTDRANEHFKSETIDYEFEELSNDEILDEIKESKVERDVEMEEIFMNENNENVKGKHEVSALLDTSNVLEIKPETDFSKSHGTENMVAIQQNETSHSPLPVVDRYGSSMQIETETDNKVSHIIENVHVIKPEPGNDINDNPAPCLDVCELEINSETKCYPV